MAPLLPFPSLDNAKRKAFVALECPYNFFRANRKMELEWATSQQLNNNRPQYKLKMER